MNTTLVRTFLARLIAVVGLTILFVGVLAGCETTQKDPAYSEPQIGEVDRPGPGETVETPPSATDYPTARSTTAEGPTVARRSSDDRPIVRTPDTPDLDARYSDAEKQQMVERALMTIKRIAVVSDETLKLSSGTESTNAGKELIEQRLAELTMNVQHAGRDLPFSPTRSQREAFREATGIELVYLLDLDARRKAKLGKFYSFEAGGKGKVLNLATGQVIANYASVLKRGQRSQDEQQAAESAVRIAAENLATYLTDESIRKWEATSLVKRQLVVRNVKTAAEAVSIRNQLQKAPGVYYVSLESFDEAKPAATYEILARFDAERNLTGYINNVVARDEVRVVKFDRISGRIDAIQD